MYIPFLIFTKTIIKLDYVRLSRNLYIHYVRLSRNLYIHYVRLRPTYLETTFVLISSEVVHSAEQIFYSTTCPGSLMCWATLHGASWESLFSPLFTRQTSRMCRRLSWKVSSKSKGRPFVWSQFNSVKEQGLCSTQPYRLLARGGGFSWVQTRWRERFCRSEITL